ncbi:DNA polymerase III subunit epsilon [Massilia yuzhufengensis]|uniref:DNA polymerase III subunit epsilon n=1 Tax=Massilia yuzhufengensis TaxID=1164594 RepID=A0A1I1MAS5_9BURK|nr:DNA polymerase III subunit epsilon [Massilia yuzhufengensis]SFC79723.1 DNA polymerase-3 subunit epsilon [Massilia yuzhufengensis]
MRQIVLDTETTGLNPRTGDRVIEIGCVEIFNRKLTGNNFHRYINPERDSDEAALAVHGLTTEFLRDKPKFHEVAEELRAFIDGAEVIIHNAPFDMGFLNAEYTRLGLPPFSTYCSSVIDTLVQAKEMHPGKRNSLDALCDRYEISNAHRKLHGALLDSELLADVYIAMTRGQNSLTMDVAVEAGSAGELEDAGPLGEIIVLAASIDELTLHEQALAGLDKNVKGSCVWRNYSPQG